MNVSKAPTCWLASQCKTTRRKKYILRELAKFRARVVVVKCGSTPKSSNRACSFNSILDFARRQGIRYCVVELDETARMKDHQLFKLRGSDFEWDHRQRHEEPLLWVSDAVAWCVNRGGDWERMVRPMVLETIEC